MCYEIVQINFDVEAIPDENLSDPENKSHADYGTRGLYPFSFPAEFLAEVAIEQMFSEYERVLSGESQVSAEEQDILVRMFEYPIGLVEIHTGELTLYRDAPRPNLDAFETSELTKLTYGLADLRVADQSYGKAPVLVHDRLESAFAFSLIGVKPETLVALTDEYLGVAMNPESTPEELDAVTHRIAEGISADLPEAVTKIIDDPTSGKGQAIAIFNGSIDGVDDDGDQPNDGNPFGGLKLRG